jgi:sn-glycerol 3-phosphate transport system ATP-binding protein
VALGRAVINEAPVCLMDEPLSNLDAQLRAEMRQEIRALQRKLGITMVYVTHDQVEAMSMADRVILLNSGRIEQNGRPVDLYETPANTFVARFIGTPPMNLLRLEPGSGGAVIAGTEGPVVLPPDATDGMLGVRPEHVQLVFGGGVRATVDNVEYLGGDSLVTCAIGGQSIAVRAPGSTALAPGDVTGLVWAPGAQHYFGADGVRHAEHIRHQTATQLA